MPPDVPTRVVIISDQPIYLQGLAALVMAIPAVRLIGEARNAAEAVQLSQLSEPDLAIIDLKNNLELGREVTSYLRQVVPQIKVILMVTPEEAARLREAPDSLCQGYFSRDISEDDFRAAFEQVRLGQEMAGQAVSGADQAEEADADEDLRASLLLVGSQRMQYRSHATLTRELVMAGKIQSSILPESPPALPGWDISAGLQPARETSGDFYDFIPLTDHKWGVVIADVTDKGIGASLFMVLSSTLIRTYTSRFPTLPALALNEVSARILADTHGSMFVTALFGVLEPLTGRFIYANAGHPPGYLVSFQKGRETVMPLRGTGMALGVLENAQWKQKAVKLGPGDLLVLYTDGVIEAEDPRGTPFGEERLLDVVLSKTQCAAAEIQSATIEAVHRFVGNAPQQDDIAVVVIRRMA